MENAVEADNWEAALSSVERNAGAPGPDGMKTKQLREHLAKHGAGIKAKLLNGSFKPSAARRKEIPKPNGGIRPLSIPNVLDRFVQQLLLTVMQPLFEPHFSEASHGFRPGRSAHGAIEAAQRQAREGRDWVVDMDITALLPALLRQDRLAVSLRSARSGEPRHPHGAGESRREGQTDAATHRKVPASRNRSARRKQKQQHGGDAARRPPLLRCAHPCGAACGWLSHCVRFTAAGQHLSGQARQGDRKPRTATRPLRRRLQHLRQQRTRCETSDDSHEPVDSEASETASQRGEEWHRPGLGTQVDCAAPYGQLVPRCLSHFVRLLGFILTVALLIAASPQALAKFKDEVRAKWDARQSVSSEQLRDAWSDYQRGWWALLSLRSPPAGQPAAGCLTAFGSMAGPRNGEAF
jgi:hypothetical protein